MGSGESARMAVNRQRFLRGITHNVFFFCLPNQLSLQTVFTHVDFLH